jgi:hypothetical protein
MLLRPKYVLNRVIYAWQMLLTLYFRILFYIPRNKFQGYWNTNFNNPLKFLRNINYQSSLSFELSCSPAPLFLRPLAPRLVLLAFSPSKPLISLTILPLLPRLPKIEIKAQLTEKLADNRVQETLWA